MKVSSVREWRPWVLQGLSSCLECLMWEQIKQPLLNSLLKNQDMVGSEKWNIGFDWSLVEVKRLACVLWWLVAHCWQTAASLDELGSAGGGPAMLELCQSVKTPVYSILFLSDVSTQMGSHACGSPFHFPLLDLLLFLSLSFLSKHYSKAQIFLGWTVKDLRLKAVKHTSATP